jgi:hypothetical protein
MLLMHLTMPSRRAAEAALVGLWLCVERNGWPTPDLRVTWSGSGRVQLRIRIQLSDRVACCGTARCPLFASGMARWCLRRTIHRLARRRSRGVFAHRHASPCMPGGLSHVRRQTDLRSIAHSVTRQRRPLARS